MLMPGEQSTARLTLVRKMPMVEGQSFTVRENKTTVATGVVTKILKPIHVVKNKMNEVVVRGLNNDEKKNKKN